MFLSRCSRHTARVMEQVPFLRASSVTSESRFVTLQTLVLVMALKRVGAYLPRQPGAVWLVCHSYVMVVQAFSSSWC